MSNIVLGVSGSVAAYRACDLARELMRAGHTVRACLTDSAQNFVSAALFEALTGHPCLQDTFEEPDQGRMAHIDWARQADLILIAPATANTLNKIASGIGDDMLTTIALATTSPLLIAPAMNPAMFSQQTTQNSLKILSARGALIVEPSEGEVACGENGQGKLASNNDIRDATLGVLTRSQKLKGKTVLITSGPTQEPLDDVRYLTNHSSGKMGHALTQAAHWMGAKVILISGPTSLPSPTFATVFRVTTAQEMLEAAKIHAPEADIVIGAAAVADYRPTTKSNGKIRRTDKTLSIELTPNPDIIATLAQKFPNKKVVAFAAEPSTELDSARSKLDKKKVHAIAVNDVSNLTIGFNSDQNELTLLTADGQTHHSGKHPKIQIALWLLDHLA
jgi:phosphopantothenoylcysteine decarboxylase/phosphopantothenate--cysteine ligase